MKNHPTKIIRAVAYCRYSSDNQREESIDAQLRAIKCFCSKEGYTLTSTYIDEAVSGTSDDRARFLDMIADASKDKFDVVLVHKLDRFARNRYDSAIYKKKLRDAGVRVVSILERLDDSPESIILESVLEGMNEYYSKNLSREVHKGMKENALKAKHNGGVPPLGFDVNAEGSYVIKEPEAEAVHKIYELFITGHGYGLIAEKLNEMGFSTKAGRAFRKNSIRDVLLNEKYIGTYIFAKGSSKEVRLEDALPSIIDKESFEKVTNRIKSRTRRPRIDTDDRRYLLIGLIRCGECGYAYSGNGAKPGRGGKRYYTYACVGRTSKKSECINTAVRKVPIEEFVIDKLKEIFFSDVSVMKLALNLITKLEDRNSKFDSEMKRLTSEATSLNKKIDKAFDLYFEDLIDKKVLARKTNTLKQKLDDINTRIDYLNQSNSAKDMSRHDIIEGLLRARDALSSGKFDQVRSVVETFIQEVVINKDNINVILKVDPGPSDDDNNGDKSSCGYEKYFRNSFVQRHSNPDGSPLMTHPVTISRDDFYKKTKAPRKNKSSQEPLEINTPSKPESLDGGKVGGGGGNRTRVRKHLTLNFSERSH